MSIYGTNIAKEVERLPDHKVYGQVTDVIGLLIEAAGVQSTLSVGDHCKIIARDGRDVRCEVIGFSKNRALLMPFGSVEGVGMGCRVEISASEPVIYPDPSWLGRVINAFGDSVDGKGPLPLGKIGYPIHNTPPPAHDRKRVGGKINLGVRVMNTFLTCCKGQRMGIFAGSGVGKSTLLSMMARHTNAEVSIVGMIGERSREAREFIEDHLGPEGMARSVAIVATSDESPLIRRQAAYVTMAVSEYFRDRNNEVLCLMDSVTRFAMAQREISLSMGEPPASKGYTPTVFAELPRLLERAGPGAKGQGSITGLFTVLVEGDDHNEPVADAVRGILDGHVVLDRAIAERGRFPPVNVLRSLSRTMPACNSTAENVVINRARQLIAIYEDMAELIRLGAYRRGSDPNVDEAVHYYPALEKFLAQEISDHTDIETCYQMLNQILDITPEEPATEAEQAPAAEAEQTLAVPAPEPKPAPPQTAVPEPAASKPSPPATPAPPLMEDAIVPLPTPGFQTLPEPPGPEAPGSEAPVQETENGGADVPEAQEQETENGGTEAPESTSPDEPQQA